MNKNEIRYLTISDIHLGHRRNSTFDIVKNLDIFFNQYKPRTDLDIIFIAGDVFDDLLDFPSDDATEASVWAARLVTFCSENKIKLRVLEGTPAHDWKQSKIFEQVVELSKAEIDFKFVKILSIEFIEDLGIHVLYVPDEWNSSTEKTFEQVKELLDNLKIDKVDLAIMHGQFGFQLPACATKAPKHDEVGYLSIVRHFIMIGHVHTFSFYERIIAQGSFDRLSHGEEEPKGGVECVIRKDGTRDFFFIENKYAKSFKTIHCKKKEVEDCIKFIDKQTKDLRIGSYVRIKADKTNPILLAIDQVKKRFSDFVISKISTEEEQEDQETDLVREITEMSYVPITIDRENIRTLLLEVISSKYTLNGDQMVYLNSELDRVV